MDNQALQKDQLLATSWITLRIGSLLEQIGSLFERSQKGPLSNETFCDSSQRCRGGSKILKCIKGQVVARLKDLEKTYLMIIYTFHPSKGARVKAV